MAPPDLNDPPCTPRSSSTPRTSSFATQPSSNRRNGFARELVSGFLVPGRISYLLFGGVPGFVVFRYVLALIAIIPTYILLRRVYSRVVGVIGVIVILSCPVIILAWGTDFPDSAAVSVPHRRTRMPGDADRAAPRRLVDRRGGAVHAFGVGARVVRAARHRDGGGVLARTAQTRSPKALARSFGDVRLCCRGHRVLAIASGGADRGRGITPYDHPVADLTSPSRPKTLANHSRSPLWAPYITYLLVPTCGLPGMLRGVRGTPQGFPSPGIGLARIGRRVASIPTAQLIVSVGRARFRS